MLDVRREGKKEKGGKEGSGRAIFGPSFYAELLYVIRIG